MLSAYDNRDERPRNVSTAPVIRQPAPGALPMLSSLWAHTIVYGEGPCMNACSPDKQPADRVCTGQRHNRMPMVEKSPRSVVYRKSGGRISRRVRF